jgi:hypothetical protein
MIKTPARPDWILAAPAMARWPRSPWLKTLIQRSVADVPSFRLCPTSWSRLRRHGSSTDRAPTAARKGARQSRASLPRLDRVAANPFRASSSMLVHRLRDQLPG